MKKIIKYYRIGRDCFYQNISVLLENKNKLSYAFKYLNNDFLYNKEIFSRFKNKETVDSFINKDNELALIKGIDSYYLEEINTFRKATSNNFFKLIIHKNEGGILEIQDIITRNGPLMFYCDPYYLRAFNEERKINVNHHYSKHLSIIKDINPGRNTCQIIDKFYNFEGEVLIDDYWKCSNSDYIQNNLRGIAYSISLKEDNKSESKRIQENLHLQLKNLKKKFIIIKGKKYLKNLYAVEALINDLEEIIQIIIDQKGKYAPQFFIQLLQPTMQEKLSFHDLMSYVKTKLNNLELDRLLDELKILSTLWITIDYLCDKCYLTGYNLKDYSERIKRLLHKIYYQEERVELELLELRNEL
ncbi:hypothetical protein HZI73_16710 [Vallitalea pronyensis]|uniref:Uncharacterized protein n=1 Tax=Vallitalea pronyensis TaxID=1348613 RepID=A0A8J8SHV9_9FIRM|nr:hypothetical protein [Vallitalea pronyensis]QUI23834.1 hypothetical protein HZI73_16710 [Vallitalea pronyensis]